MTISNYLRLIILLKVYAPRVFIRFAQGSRKGECHDNAVAENFFNTIKTELINQQTYQTREQSKSGIFEYIEVFYNKIRRHSTIDYQPPNDFERLFYQTMV